MVCRDNFFNVKYAIDMAELTESYIKGFVETCFKAGVHEKQAAAMLDLVAESSAMEKSAAGAFKNLATGISQLLKGVGNTAVGTGKIVFGAPWKLAIKPAYKAGKFIHQNAMVEPIKQYVKDKNYLAALVHAGVFGALPPALGFTTFQNWRANSDSKVADAINDYLGDPELLVFNGTPEYKDTSTSRYGRNSSLSPYNNNNNDSPFNIPGTVAYTPGERQLQGEGTASNELLVPDSVKPLMERHRDLRTSIDNLRRSRMNSNSATERSRINSDNARALQDELDELTRRIARELDLHNRQVAINESHIKQRQLDAARALSRAKRQDIYQAGIDLGDDTWYGRLGNDALEAIGIRDTDADAAARATELRNLEQASRDADQLRPGESVDVQAILNMLNN
jgi:hypothetical protein